MMCTKGTVSDADVFKTLSSIIVATVAVFKY